MPAILARRLRIDATMVFGTCHYNCVSVLSAIDLAEHILAHEDEDARVLILVGENARNMEIRIIPNVAIVGDAACAALVRRNGDNDRLLGLAIHVHSGFSEGIWLSGASSASRAYDEYFRTWLSEVIEDALGKTTIGLHEVSWILPHNVNVWMWRKAAAFLGFPIERVFLENARQFAHCQGADMLLNLEELKRSKSLRKGDYYLMATAGVGGIFGAAVFQH
ncbi:3-oxoacyl-ACP synthase [Phyllobacterium salinisoli]|uniref:3-oxoacyl-ACP synthase n=1 Tax=Phyllobacterium salinisoli TaxID=1899321 RepID=A0A368JWF3_9HYPH|nr:3-oxoacyl-[acyl-carrier-protein] synthase III C-terminal domain-containing protein [Phyllobacterium salinisoli]RCS21499.1 3-oxoacyl-ACP synthase [Phyllobacterium salinisoli]